MAEERGQVLGRGTLVLSPVHRDSYYVDITVEPADRRRGVGRAIFTSLLDYACPGYVLLARAMPSQPDRLPFAEALGFKVLMRCPSPQLDPTSGAAGRWIDDHPSPRGVTVISAGERPVDEVLDAWTDYYVWVHAAWSPTYPRDTVRGVFAASGLAEVDFELSRLAIREDEIVALAFVLPHQWNNRSFVTTETVRPDLPNGMAILGGTAAAALQACANRGLVFAEFEGHVVDPHYYPLSQTLPVTGADPLLVLSHAGRT